MVGQAAYSSWFSLQLASVFHKTQPSRLRWLGKPFPTAGTADCTQADLINTVLYLRFSLNAAAAPASVSLLGPPRLGLIPDLSATGGLTGAETVSYLGWGLWGNVVSQ